MTVHLRPELESLIQADIERGPYRTVDEFVERAVELLHEQEEWFSQNRAEIAAQIQIGFDQAQHGESVDPDRARQILRDRRATRTTQS